MNGPISLLLAVIIPSDRHFLCLRVVWKDALARETSFATAPHCYTHFSGDTYRCVSLGKRCKQITGRSEAETEKKQLNTDLGCHFLGPRSCLELAFYRFHSICASIFEV